MPAKKIREWEPENFELEITTHWTFPERGNWSRTKSFSLE